MLRRRLLPPRDAWDWAAAKLRPGVHYVSVRADLSDLLPAVAACLEARQGDASGQVPAPAALVVLPTRELAQQVHRVCRPFQRLFGLRAACVTGGIDKAAQLAQLRDGPLALLAGTPGRLHELIGAEDRPETAVLSRGRVRLLVLDEGDKLLTEHDGPPGCASP